MSKQNSFIQSVGQINVPVRNLEEATHFYQNTLGLSLIFHVPDMMSFFDCGGVRIMLAIPTSAEFDHPSSVIYYRVADIHQTYAALKAKQVEFTQDPHSVGQMGDVDVWMAFFKDSDGNHLAIMSELSESKTEL